MSVSEVCVCIYTRMYTCPRLTIGVKFRSTRSKLPFPTVGGDSDGRLSEQHRISIPLLFSFSWFFG